MNGQLDILIMLCVLCQYNYVKHLQYLRLYLQLLLNWKIVKWIQQMNTQEKNKTLEKHEKSRNEKKCHNSNLSVELQKGKKELKHNKLLKSIKKPWYYYDYYYYYY